ncbi:MAG: hypothetical protein WCO60_16415 [Verrucomicrobiota bacterium]
MSTQESSASTPSRNSLDPLVERAEVFTREKPGKALSAAFGLGILMALLPIGSIVGGLIRLTLLLLRPVLVILGLVRLYEEFGHRCCKQAQDEEQK